MIETINPHWAKNKKKINLIFIVIGILLLGYTICAIFTSPESVKDCIFEIIVISIFYIVQKYYHVPIVILIIGVVPIFLHLNGIIFGLYDAFIFGIGYDKIIHFTNAFSGTIVTFYLMIAHSKRMPLLKVAAAILIIVGIGALVENFEFVGSRYFDMKGPTIFSQEGFSQSVQSSILKTLSVSPSVQKDMIEQDTEWDMLFNTLGCITAAIALSILWHVDKDNLRDRTITLEE